MPVIPAFNRDGLLPPGDYVATLDELRHHGQGSGLQDEFGHELEFPSAFRRSRRDGKPRGIVKVVRS